VSFVFTSSFTLAFGFGNLAMLGWLGAIAAPLLIHLWSRHRYREAPWAAMQFLLAAMRKNARRLQLQQWLLLAVRMLIIALVVLAVAEPYGERLLADLSGTPTHKVLVIDGSFSMAYRHQDESRFARAKQLASQLVRDSRSADTFTVILLAAPSATLLDRNVIDRAAITNQIDALTQSHTGADLAGALTRVDDAITRDAAHPNASIRHQVCFLTDLQSITWEQSASPGKQQTSIIQRIESLAKKAELIVIDLGSKTSRDPGTTATVVGSPVTEATNTAVTSLSSSEPLITVGREIFFDATLRQFGAAVRKQCSVELLVDSEPVAEQTIDLPAGADVTVRFDHRFQSAGEHTVEIRAAGDHLDIDNSRWLVVPVHDHVRVLCVAGRPDAAKYIAGALNPNPAGESPIEPVVISEGDLAEVDLGGFDCVFMCNVAQLTTSEAVRLKRFAQAGGGIVFFLGDRVDPQSYNARASGKNPLLPAAMGDIVNQRQFGIDPLDYRHPIVAPFRGRERAGLLTTPIARYHRVAVPSGSPTVQVAAAMQNGDPLIVTAPLGLGRTVLVATDGSLSSADAETGEPWTNWPTWPSFLPIIRELLAYATSGRQQEWQQLVGTPLASRGVLAPASAVNSTLKIERPDKRTDAVSLHSTPSGTEWSYADTDLSGLYTLHGLPDDKSRTFALNVDTRESDLAQVDPQQLPSELHLLGAAADASPTSSAPGISRAGWNESLLWAALALIFAESFLAWQFGRGVL
jgi:hypothetical protein